MAISKRLDASIEEAEHWAKRMPREAASLVGRARTYSVAAGGISFFVGLLAWPLSAQSPSLTAQVVISGLSGMAALAIAAPYASGLSDHVDESLDLCRAYGVMHRELLDAKAQLVGGSRRDLSRVADVLSDFECIQERRDALPVSAGGSGRGRVDVASPEQPEQRQRESATSPVREQIVLEESHEPVRPLPPSVPVIHGPEAAIDDETLAALVHVVMSRSLPESSAPAARSCVPAATPHPLPSPARNVAAGSANGYGMSDPLALPGQVSRRGEPSSYWGEFIGSLVETGHSATLLGRDSTNAVAAYLGLAERTVHSQRPSRPAEPPKGS